ncbi:hypothetical protein [Glycomyces buryatensis]|uniref:Uncharacterized protein n=1 Tax=Glycomyces buryatensis TaxID=2570927 RepID=A0A4S8QL44_9ACTN|nr:hypothetical protein [Glycomyces buryatensis]THV41444.1 hypothetical protein FAB82_11640 [Glycomyces buryatensis]
MTTHEHDTPLKLCRSRPDFAVELAGDLLGVPIPDHDEVVPYSESATDAQVRDLNCDNVVLCRAGRRNRLGIIVEVQRGTDSRKRFSWPAYQANIRHRIKAPVVLVVVCPGTAVASWARAPIETGHPDFILRPLVLGPDNYPRHTTVSGTGVLAERMVLGSLVHQHDSDIDPLLTAALKELSVLPEERATRYADYMLGQLEQRPRTILEAMMQNETYPYQSKLLLDREARGKAEGEAQGLSEALLDFVEARNLSISENQRRRIERCQDPGQLRAWIKKAATVPTVADIIE